MKNEEWRVGRYEERGRRKKRVQACFLPKTPPPPNSHSFSPFPCSFRQRFTKRNEKNVRLCIPPSPPPATDGKPRTHLPFSRYSGVRPADHSKKKKKNLLGWLVGSFLFRIASSIIVTFFFFLMFWWFGVLSSNCSFAFFVHLQLSWYSVYTGSFSQCSDFLRFCDFCEFVEKNKQEKKKLQGMFCVAYEMWLIANVENIGDVLVPVWSLYDRLVDILHLRERRSDGSVSKSFERDISKSFEP